MQHLLIQAQPLAENIVSEAAMSANHPAMMDFPPALPLSLLLHPSKNLNEVCIKYINEFYELSGDHSRCK